jgi:hypothetical protein
VAGGPSDDELLARLSAGLREATLRLHDMRRHDRAAPEDAAALWRRLVAVTALAKHDPATALLLLEPLLTALEETLRPRPPSR